MRMWGPVGFWVKVTLSYLVGGKVLNLCSPGCPWKRRSPLRPLAPKALMPVSRTVLCDLWIFSGQSSWDLGVSGWVLLVSFPQVAGWFRRMRPFKGSRDTTRTNPPLPWWQGDCYCSTRQHRGAGASRWGHILHGNGLMLNFWTTSSKVTWQWKITIFNREYIFK